MQIQNPVIVWEVHGALEMRRNSMEYRIGIRQSPDDPLSVEFLLCCRSGIPCHLQCLKQKSELLG